MNRLWKLEAVAAAVLAATLAGCTGGQETTAETLDGASAGSGESAVPAVNPEVELAKISGAIPLYSGAEFRQDLTRRDETLLKRQHGPQTEIYTLVTTDSFPQVWHYYVTYLAQYRAFDPPKPFPPQNRVARTFEVDLNAAMQDPFIPGDAIGAGNRRVTLQLAEADGSNETVIRYIVTQAPPAPATAIASNEIGTGTVEPRTGGVPRTSPSSSGSAPEAGAEAAELQ